MHEQTVQELEMSIEQAKALVDRAVKVQQLYANPLFREIILEGYFTHEAARLVHLAHDPNLHENVRQHIKTDLAGPPAFKRYLVTIEQMGYQAAKAMHEAQDMISEIETNPEGFSEVYGEDD